MLVLSRKIGEEIVVGKDIRIRTLQIRGNRVRLGITAPDSVPVHRHEVHRRIMDPTELPHDVEGCQEEHPAIGTQTATHREEPGE